MSRIRVLPDRVANQIAAGEVIERPAAAVKELLENALDAGATRVEVEFRHAGEELIRVEDNGSGMGRDDALLSLERHATSKIGEAADLDRLASFGFRGEALPSIASVSKFTLRTRAGDADAGTEVVVNAGKIWHVRDCGRPVGTAVSVEHLFHPVPARRKFLKSEATEAGHIVQVVRLYALAFPQVAFSLVQDGKRVFQSPRGSGLDDRVREIFGRDVGEGLLKVEADEGAWKLSGLIGRPGQGRAGKQEMVAFVNRRPVDSRAIHFALIEAYRESLPQGRYPVAFVFLTCDPSQVDVNVHPAKREVRFREEQGVRSFIIRSVLHRLREYADSTRPSFGLPSRREAPHGVGAFPPPPSSDSGHADPAMGQGVGKTPTPQDSLRAENTYGVGAEAAPDVGRVEEPPVRPSLKEWRWLGMTAEGYALFETGAGLVLFDPSAARERVVFEKLKADIGRGGGASQRLLLAVALELDPITSAMLLDARELLAKHGFELAEFGRHFFRLEGIPLWLDPGEAEPFLRDLLAAIRDGRLDPRDADLSREQLAALASSHLGSSRLLPGGATTESGARAQLQDLFATPHPLTSPAGRPTFIELGWNEIARRFRR